MPDLIAQGAEPHQRWRHSLPPRQKILIGRAAGPWGTPWDRMISRQHVEVQFRHGRLQVQRLSSATNPVFLRGQALDQFALRAGEHFVIGQTTFTLADEKVNIAPDQGHPVTEHTFSAQYLQRLQFRNADQRIEVLGRLPEIISGATSDSELFVRLVNVLLAGIPRASAAAIVAVRDEGASAAARIEVLHWDRRVLTGEDFRPSERLILKAIDSNESVAHLWKSQRPEDRRFTQIDDADWALCTPLAGEACRGWAIYVTGKSSATNTDGSGSEARDLQDDLKFIELAGSTLSSLRKLKQLERSHTSLRQFLSPVVLQAVGDSDWEAVLKPRECEVSVLFCDLRGFSRESERHADDIWNLLNRVSRALGVATHHILDQSGVVGDFHGDAVMGFWGWPLSQKDAVSRAALAALGIRAEFEAAACREGHALRNFRIGIGIATGRAVAGKIGTTDQVTVTVFGPVVNLASRLEGMTKFVHAPILVDQPTAVAIRSQVSPMAARVRKIAVVRPYGLESAIEVSELLPPESEYPQLTDGHVAAFEQAADAMISGDWHKAFNWLQKVPAEDRVKDFLTVFMARHDRTPPRDWNGTILLDSK